nr:MAG TPA: hypothetical protein [Caudoviricetes sp.]
MYHYDTSNYKPIHKYKKCKKSNLSCKTHGRVVIIRNLLRLLIKHMSDL